MFRSLIAGVAALGLIATAAPDRAEASDNDVLRGVIAGAIILGTIAALDDRFDKKRSHSHSHKHVRVKPKYGHQSHRVLRKGTRVYSDRDRRIRLSNNGHRIRNGNSHRQRDVVVRNANRRNSNYHSHGDYRHKNHGEHKAVVKKSSKKHVGDGRKHTNGKQVKRLVAQKERLVHQNARLRRQLDRREQYVQKLRKHQK